jgi:hypothetical protein
MKFSQGSDELRFQDADEIWIPERCQFHIGAGGSGIGLESGFG